LPDNASAISEVYFTEFIPLSFTIEDTDLNATVLIKNINEETYLTVGFNNIIIMNFTD
jgi:hypothetical protein